MAACGVNMKHHFLTEDWREYDYGNGNIYHIKEPRELFIKEGGTGHRIVDAYGVTHWCPINTWHVIRWYAPDEPVQF